MFRQKYDKKKSDASFWDILLVSVMSGKIITREVRNFVRKNCQNADSRSAEFPCSNSVCLLLIIPIVQPNFRIRLNEKGERQTQQNESWKSERARYYIISTDLYNHIVLQTIYFRLTGSKYSLKSQILEYIIFPLCNCLS